MTGDITPEQAAKIDALLAQILDGEIGVPACPTAEDVERMLQRATGITEPLGVSNVRIEGASLCFTLTVPRWAGVAFGIGNE